MKINLNLLKFHSFKYNNKIHNLVLRNSKEYFDNLFFLNKQSLQKILECVKEINSFNECKGAFSRIHTFNDDKKYMFYKIISKEHPKLKKSLDQFFSSYKEYNLFQLKLSKSERLIFIIEENPKIGKVFCPLLFDLNHCIYSSKEKKHHWTFKEKQEEIKNKLLKKNF